MPSTPRPRRRAWLAAQAHLGQGLTANGPVHGWNGAGALTPIDRFATMFSGYPMQNVDGTEWYFPQRLTDDTGAVDNGNANPAQSVLDVDATMGHHLPKNLLHLRLRRAPRGSLGAPRPHSSWLNSPASR